MYCWESVWYLVQASVCNIVVFMGPYLPWKVCPFCLILQILQQIQWNTIYCIAFYYCSLYLKVYLIYIVLLSLHSNGVGVGVGVCLWHLISKLSYIGIACNEDAVNLWTDLKLQLQLQLQLLKAKTKTITYLTIFTGMYIGPLRRLAVSLLLQV